MCVILKKEKEKEKEREEKEGESEHRETFTTCSGTCSMKNTLRYIK